MAKKAKRRSPLVKLMESDEEKLYETTIEDCETWFKILNREVFDNSLSPITEFCIGRTRKAHAYYECTNTTNIDAENFETRIRIDTRFTSKKFFVEVLFHEMVHHYQILHRQPFGHGPSFRKWAPIAKKHGLTFGTAL